MAKILILYSSKDGSTAKMAGLVAEGVAEIPDVEVKVLSIEEATPEDVLACDGLALGASTHLGGIPWQMKKFWDETMIKSWSKLDGKIACAFTSQGGWGGGGEIACMALNSLLMNYGFLVFGVTDYVAHQFTLHYGSTIAGEPRTEREMDSPRRLGRRLAEWVAFYVDGKSDQHPLNNERKRFPW